MSCHNELWFCHVLTFHLWVQHEALCNHNVVSALFVVILKANPIVITTREYSHRLRHCNITTRQLTFLTSIFQAAYLSSRCCKHHLLHRCCGLWLSLSARRFLQYAMPPWTHIPFRHLFAHHNFSKSTISPRAYASLRHLTSQISLTLPGLQVDLRT